MNAELVAQIERMLDGTRIDPIDGTEYPQAGEETLQLYAVSKDGSGGGSGGC